MHSLKELLKRLFSAFYSPEANIVQLCFYFALLSHLFVPLLLPHLLTNGIRPVLSSYTPPGDVSNLGADHSQIFICPSSIVVYFNFDVCEVTQAKHAQTKPLIPFPASLLLQQSLLIP